MNCYEIIVTMLILSLFTTVSPAIPQAASTESSPNSDRATIPVVLNLTEPGIDLNKTNIMVTVLDGENEVEVPFTAYPDKRIGFDYVYKFMYKGKDTSMLSYEEFKKLQEDISSSKNISRYITVMKTHVDTLISDAASGRIVVYLPRSIKPSRPEYNRWYKGALANGFNTRARYRYGEYTILVYYGSGSVPPRSPLFVSTPAPNTILLVNRYDYRKGILYPTDSFSISIAREEMVSAGKAEYVEIERAPSMGSLSSNMKGIWYYIPWSTEVYGKKPYILDTVFYGKTYYYLEDSFKVLDNTTHLEVWAWLSTDESVGFHMEMYMGYGNKILDDDFSLSPGILYGVGVLVDGNNYIDPGDVLYGQILRGVTRSDAHIAVHVVVVARSEVVLPSDRDYYFSYYRVKGVGKIYGVSPGYDKAVDERYEFPHDGRLIGYIMPPGNLYERGGSYPFIFYPRVYLYIESTEDQKYDRYIDVYLNGLRVGRVKTYSVAPNGTQGRRWAWLVTSSSVEDAILNAMRMRQSIQVIVEIEGYDPNIDSTWYIKSFTVGVLSRPVWLGTHIHDMDPVSPRKIGKHRTLITSNDYAFIGLFGGDNVLHTDMREYETQLSYKGIDVGGDNELRINLDYWYGGRLYVDNNYVSEYHFVSRIEAQIDIYASLEDGDIELSGYTAFVPGGDENRGDLNVVEYGLWLASLGLCILSFGTSSWLIPIASLSVTIFSYPGFFVQATTTSFNCYYVNDDIGEKHIRCNFEYYPSYNTNPISLRVFLDKTDHPWSSGDSVHVVYKIKTYAAYVTVESDTQWERQGYIYDSGSTTITPFK